MRKVPVARPDDIRRHNLGLLLGQVHRDGELSRAELTQRLGLSRSTIGALAGDLRDLGLVEQRVPIGGDRAGRPSHVVGPRADGPFAVAVDLDVTHITTAAVGLGGHVLRRHVVATEPKAQSPLQAAKQIVEAADLLVREIGPDAWPIGIGVSVPGTVNQHTLTVEFAPNLSWRNQPLGAILSGLVPTSLPVSLGNDADLAVLAEHLRGAARDCDDAVYLIGRIGVGAGIIVNGLPLRGRDGHAGEVGHNVVDPAGPRCHCGKRGCLETYIGEHALLKAAGRRQSPTTEHVHRVFTDAARGDARARAAVDTVAEGLGWAVAGLVNLFNPQRVILGGTLASVYTVSPDAVESALQRHTMEITSTAGVLCLPALDEDSSLLGAAELAFASLLADPIGGRAAR